ncbi:MAG: hypothetical protein AB1351_01405 [Thermoproteota archaeon]
MNQTTKGKENGNNSKQDPKNLPSAEVFDSSRYNAMNDMTKGSTANRLPDEQAVIDVQTKEPLNPRDVRNESLTAEGPPKQSDAKINPMMTEERARTIREIHEETSPNNGGENTQEIRVIEHRSHGYNAIPDWAEVMMRQYIEMATAGMKIYSEFLKNSTDMARLWFTAWLPSNKE